MHIHAPTTSTHVTPTHIHTHTHTHTHARARTRYTLHAHLPKNVAARRHGEGLGERSFLRVVVSDLAIVSGNPELTETGFSPRTSRWLPLHRRPARRRAPNRGLCTLASGPTKPTASSTASRTLSTTGRRSTLPLCLQLRPSRNRRRRKGRRRSPNRKAREQNDWGGAGTGRDENRRFKGKLFDAKHCRSGPFFRRAAELRSFFC